MAHTIVERIPEPKLLKPVEDNSTPLYRPMTGKLSGFPQCCSAATMHNFSSAMVGTPMQCYRRPPTVIPYQQFHTLKEYKAIYGNHSTYAIPEEEAYLFYLEKIWPKVTKGRAIADNPDYPFYSGTTWATKTLVIADRMTARGYQNDYLSCSSFMRFMRKSERSGDYGRMAVSNLADGAHGGQCAAGAWAPNLPYIEERIRTAIIDLNLHVMQIENLYGTDKGEIDEVAATW